jgi:hypothetical protein
VSAGDSISEEQSGSEAISKAGDAPAFSLRHSGTVRKQKMSETEKIVETSGFESREMFGDVFLVFYTTTERINTVTKQTKSTTSRHFLRMFSPDVFYNAEDAAQEFAAQLNDRYQELLQQE